MCDSIESAIQESGLLSSSDCLRCEVCCRFPDATSPLAPFFSNAEIERVVACGMPRGAFPPGTYGPGHAAELAASGSIFQCPAFDVSSNSCTLYAARPLDCRLYPFMLMYDRLGEKAWLGLDSYCPVVNSRKSGPNFSSCVSRLAELLDGTLRGRVWDSRGMVTAWKEHVHPLVELPGLSRDLCSAGLGLARLVPTARDALSPFFEAHGGSLSYHAFAPIYVWRDIFDLRWKVCGERLLIFAEGDGDCFLICPPLGSGPVTGPAEEALSIMRRLNPNAASPRIQDADESLADALVSSGWRVRESHVEYVYRRSDLAELRGNRYAKKRPPCSRFEREHAWRWRAFEPEDLPAAVALYGTWLSHRGKAHPDDFFMAQAEASFRCAYRGLCEADGVGLDARALEADNRLVGFTVGFPSHDGKTYQVLFEISDLTMKGAAQFMFRESCREMDAFEWVNTGSASCLPSLAKVKDSYRPSRRLRSLTLVRDR